MESQNFLDPVLAKLPQKLGFYTKTRSRKFCDSTLRVLMIAGSELGHGYFGTVFKATWNNSVRILNH